MTGTRRGRVCLLHPVVEGGAWPYGRGRTGEAARSILTQIGPPIDNVRTATSRSLLCCNRAVEPDVRVISRWSLAWRISVAVIGIGLLLNGSLRMSDDVWPFGPLSQYAFSPPRDATIVITRVEGRLADGHRIDLPLRVQTAGISRAEIEARIPAITSDPSLLRSVVDGWTRRHPGEPEIQQVWLVQDETRLVDGRRGPTRLVELAAWEVPR